MPLNSSQQDGFTYETYFTLSGILSNKGRRDIIHMIGTGVKKFNTDESPVRQGLRQIVFAVVERNVPEDAFELLKNFRVNLAYQPVLG